MDDAGPDSVQVYIGGGKITVQIMTSSEILFLNCTTSNWLFVDTMENGGQLLANVVPQMHC